MGVIQYVSTSALSLTLSGNTGVAPFLTLFLVGIIEKSEPTLLHMDGWIEKVIASWPGLVMFGGLAILEFVGKCVPVVDEIIDSAMTFVVPMFSVIGSLASHGLFTAPAPPINEAGEPEVDIDGRRLEGEVDNSNGSKSNVFLTLLQVLLSTVGVFLALLVHLCTMLLLLMGEGCCTPCITTAEIIWVMCSVTICIFVVPIAIGAAMLLCIAAGFGFKSWWQKRQKKNTGASASDSNVGVGHNGGETPVGGGRKELKSGDEEQGNQQKENVKQSRRLNPEYNVGETTKSAGETPKDEKLRPVIQ
mmetsp:Transcript_18487/g.29001  ORF Transcript_18487/g.29001 Transcript_18487/m.29001 type:complete len:304 (-) Transcript_18487:211-1122(-)|eukprot:CAMPEP_0201609092 /NCGR_PEP_ID=MMETSP0492-20130828/11412_1 /ASSEMBLY_ACC=CAM_ASM_000837 /TAXON_ID=420259 /ORGANISM="Thalassiosira gravida, Strain GMp14c1" /LENGTH=303 /DNA_ID=CAMNT_0048074317 /DNA_START=51 /DNA_END=962 /DNA_ORIENTATION=+